MSREIVISNALVRHRGRWLSVHVGTYHDVVTMALATKRKGKITSVRDITRAQYGRVTDCMEIYVRGRMWRAVNMLLKAGEPTYPIYDANGHHKVIGLKVIARYTDKDMAALNVYLDMAVKRNEIAFDKVNLIRTVMDKLRSQLNGK
jgi:hypothetical protein